MGFGYTYPARFCFATRRRLDFSSVIHCIFSRFALLIIMDPAMMLDKLLTRMAVDDRVYFAVVAAGGLVIMLLLKMIAGCLTGPKKMTKTQIKKNKKAAKQRAKEKNVSNAVKKLKEQADDISAFIASTDSASKTAAVEEEDEGPPPIQFSTKALAKVTSKKKKKNKQAADDDMFNFSGKSSKKKKAKAPTGAAGKTSTGGSGKDTSDDKPSKTPQLNQQEIDDGWEVAAVSKKHHKKPKAKSQETKAAESGKAKITVDARKIGILIGPKGSTLHAIQDATNVQINVPRGGEGSTSTVTIEGSAEGIANARAAIKDLFEKGYCSYTTGDDFAEDFVMVHPSYFPDLIGKNGRIIKAIQDSVGARLNIPKIASGTASASRARVAITGPKQSVQVAKDIVYSIMQFYHHEITHPGMIHETVDIPEYNRSLIIGTKGSVIHHIQNNWGVNVVMPSDYSLNQNCLVVGAPDSVKAAKKYILKLLHEAEEEYNAQQEEHGLGLDDGDDDWVGVERTGDGGDAWGTSAEGW